MGDHSTFDKIEVLQGGCLCQAIQFEVTNQFTHFHLCHCYQCQKMTGSAHVSNLFTTKDAIKWLQGETETKRYTVPGRQLTNVFCQHCGSPVPHIASSGKSLIVPAGSLEGEPNLLPQDHIFMGESRKWHEHIDEAICFSHFPESK